MAHDERKANRSEEGTDVDEMPVYQALFKLATSLERATRKYGLEFRWLRIQSVRSSESVCANLTEGFYSQYSTEYLQALYRSRREARETMTHLSYAMEVAQLLPNIGSDLVAQYDEALKQLANVIVSIERKSVIVVSRRQPYPKATSETVPLICREGIIDDRSSVIDH